MPPHTTTETLSSFCFCGPSIISRFGVACFFVCGYGGRLGPVAPEQRVVSDQQLKPPPKNATLNPHSGYPTLGQAVVLDIGCRFVVGLFSPPLSSFNPRDDRNYMLRRISAVIL